MPVSKKSKQVELLLATNIVSCPICHSQCVVVSADGNRFIIRHATFGAGVSECELKDKVWVLPQATITAEEV